MDLVIENRIIRNRALGRLVSDLLLTVLLTIGAILVDTALLRLLFIISLIFCASDIGYSARQFMQARKHLQNLPIKTKLETAEDRFDELERLKRRDMVTPEEYAVKRQEILKDL
jgi:hypothetical protein